jgi:hypothetical protein
MNASDLLKRLTVFSLVSSLFLILLMPNYVSAQDPVRRQFIETNGQVNKMISAGDIIYMAGSFTKAGYRTGGIARFTTTNDFPILISPEFLAQ